MTTTQLALPRPDTTGDGTGPRRFAPILPALLYLGVQGVALLVLRLFTALNHRPFNLHAWDGDWYLAIARYGYSGVPTSMTDALGHHTPNTAMAFFPAYPMLVHLAEPLEGGNFYSTAITISVLSGVIAAFGVARLVRRVTGSSRTALIAVVLLASAPMSIVYTMAYPESMLVALSVWALVGVVETRWTLAGWCAGVAGLVRPTAITIIIVVLAATITAAVRNRDRFVALGSALVAPAGLLGYLAWVATASGSPWTYFQVQKSGWRTSWDFGVGTMKWIWTTLTVDNYAFTVVTVLVVIVSVGLLIASARRVPWSAWAFAAATVALTIGETGIQFNKARLLLPATIVLLIPVAARLNQSHTAKLAALTTLLAACGIWFSAYSLSAWHYGI